MALLAVLSIMVGLFFIAFVTKRRFGVLGLGLSAGALLSSNWNQQMAAFLERNELLVPGATSDVLASCLLILLPAILLLFGGPKYTKSHAVFIGSLGFALMAGLLLLGPMSILIEPKGIVGDILKFVAEYQSGLVALGVAFAIMDMLLIHGPKFGRHKEH
jgi:hypothetical protein